MRISRLAREHNLSVQELTSYLDTLDPPLNSIHPNAKLGDETIELVLEHFNLEREVADVVEIPAEPEDSEESTVVESASIIEESPEVEEKAVEVNDNKDIPNTPEEEIALLDGELEIADEVVIEESIKKEEDPTPETSAISEEEIILSDQLIELLDSEEQPEDLDKIKLIKAPKKKLSGLKVLDKIEIPEDPKKSNEEDTEEKTTRVQLSPEEKAERVRKREEYKEKRRLEAKRKKEEFEARKEKRKRTQEANRLKAEREKHYKEQLTKQKVQATHKKSKKPQTKATAEPSQSVVVAPEKPKTIFGRFWRWLNT